MVRFHAALFPQKTIAGNTAKERRIFRNTTGNREMVQRTERIRFYHR